MIDRSFVMLVELLQIFDEIVDALSIQKLGNLACQKSHCIQVLTFRITCDGSVLLIALRYCCIAVSKSPF